MEDDKNRILDLDDLFGQNKAVKVKWKEKEYELLSLEGISPKQSVQFHRMQVKVVKLQMSETNGNGSKDVNTTDEDAIQIEAIIDEMLIILSNELPIHEIPFGGKMRILSFYMEVTRGQKALE